MKTKKIIAPQTSTMKPQRLSRRVFFSIVLFLCVLLPLSSPALVMQENGPEPVIVQIKESLRTSDDLDQGLDELTSTQRENGLKAEKWWAGSKLLVMLSFPAEFSEKQALAVIAELKRLPAVEKVVAVSAYNLEFKSGDFAREYADRETLPDAARRGFDTNRPRPLPSCTPPPSAWEKLPHVPNRLIVRWKDEYVWKGEERGFFQNVADFHRDTGCRVLSEQRPSPTRLIQVLEFDDPKTLAEKLQSYMASGLVEYAQPDCLYKPIAAFPSATPNDPVYNAYPGPQWGLPLIKAPQAWALTTGNDSVIIAVGDSGAPVDGPLFFNATPHPDFLGNIWSGQNTGEIHNYFANIPSVADDYGHGSHVASIIGAQGNNGLGMTGVAWDVSLMILKIIGPTGNFSGYPNPSDEDERDAFSSSVSSAIYLASGYGATAINLSVVGTYFEVEDCEPIQMYDPLVTEAIREARNNGAGGMLIVAGAGNGSATNDYNGYVLSPTSIPLDNVIAVGATDINDHRAPYSNHGEYRVDLGAPGGTDTNPVAKTMGLKQTWNGNSFDPANYSFNTGTSFATPYVTGAAALVKSRYPWETYLGVRDRILMGVDHFPYFAGDFRTQGRLNVFKALHKRTLLRNISTRARVEDGERVLIGGFVIGGSTSDPSLRLRVILRGLGPSVGVPVARLENPKIDLFDSSGAMVASNDNWRDDPSRDELISSGFQPAFDNEAATIQDLLPGAYTLVVSAVTGTSFGVGLVEINEFSGATNERSRLLNLSTRCYVGTGDNAAIAGMIVGEPTPLSNPVNNPAVPDRRMLMMGKGPTLGNYGISNPLPDPHLDLYEIRNANGIFRDSNDTWHLIDGPHQPFAGGRPGIFKGNALEEELVEANFFSCIPGSSPCQYSQDSERESALWPTLRPGTYTTVLSPQNGVPGVGLIEFYEY